MAAIDYARFSRILHRCEEIAEEPGMKTSVVLVYQQVLAPLLKTYLFADDAVTAAESSFAKENHEASAALVALDGPYREARSVTAAFVTGVVLPDTLKSQRTDTDKMSAIEDLIGVIDDHAGETWADSLAQGAFGKKGPETMKEIMEAIEANKELTEARKARAAAYGPAYEAYLKLKRVVRDVCGPTSKQYKRIHFRDTNGAAKAEAPPVTNGAPVPGNGAAPA
ncbi:MAG: hypothetical protein U0359_22415 [Byssovorax sp.]